MFRKHASSLLHEDRPHPHMRVNPTCGAQDLCFETLYNSPGS